MKIPITNLTPESAIKRDVKIRRHNKTISKDKKFGAMIVLLFLFGLSLSNVTTGVVDANKVYKLSNSICDTDRCRARIDRLNICEGDIKCATSLTLERSHQYIFDEITELKGLAEAGQSWKAKTIELTIKHEGLSLVAYCDKLTPFTRSNGTRGLKKDCRGSQDRYSIGYGTLSYKGEKINKVEATERMKKEFENNFFPFVDNERSECWNDNQKAAIVDLMYNSGPYTKHAITGRTLLSYVEACDYKEVLGYLDYWLYAGGVKGRRLAERDLFLSK